jgi:hypothetical protein
MCPPSSSFFSLVTELRKVVTLALLCIAEEQKNEISKASFGFALPRDLHFGHANNC